MSDDDTCTTDHTQWLDEIASGAHDDALVRLAAAAVAGAEPSAWDDPRFVEWWIARAQGAAVRAAARLSDAQHLAYPEILLSRDEDSLVRLYTIVGKLRHGSG